MKREPVLNENAFLLMLVRLRHHANVTFSIDNEPIDTDTFIELMAAHDPKASERLRQFVDAGKRLRDYINERYPQLQNATVVENTPVKVEGMN